MRLFIGIDIPEELRRRLQAYIARLDKQLPPGSVKWTHPEGWHITLKFLGETTKIDAIKSALQAPRVEPFEIRLRDVGFFTPRSPRVFWAGIEASGALPALAAEIEGLLAPLGFPREDKPYRPHITLARFGSGRPGGSSKDRNKPKMYLIKHLLEADPELTHVDFGSMMATEFFLYESLLSSRGATYVKLQSFGRETIA